MVSETPAQYGSSSTWGPANSLSLCLDYSLTEVLAHSRCTQFLLAMSLLILFTCTWFICPSCFFAKFQNLKYLSDTSLMPSLHKSLAILSASCSIMIFPSFQHHSIFCKFMTLFLSSSCFPSVSLCSPQTLLNTWIYVYFLCVFCSLNVQYITKQGHNFYLNWVEKIIFPLVTPNITFKSPE